MNINTVIFLLALFFDFETVAINTRAARRDRCERACVRRRNTAMAAIGDGLEEGKIKVRYLPDFDKEDKTRWKVSHRWDTFYFKERSPIDNGRIHAGDRHRKGKRPYGGEPVDKIRIRQALQDYYEE